MGLTQKASTDGCLAWRCLQQGALTAGFRPRTTRHVNETVITSHAGRSGVIGAAGKEKAMWETLREAIDEEMEADPTVLVMGPCDTHHPSQPLFPSICGARYYCTTSRSCLFASAFTILL